MIEPAEDHRQAYADWIRSRTEESFRCLDNRFRPIAVISNALQYPGMWAILGLAALIAGNSDAEPILGSDQRAAAAAVEIWQNGQLTTFSPHKQATAFWDDAGINLAEYLQKDRTGDGPRPKSCKATDVTVIPLREPPSPYIPKDMLVSGGVREIGLVILCDGAPPRKARITYQRTTIAELQYIVEGEPD